MESNLCRKEAYLSGKKDTLDIESLAKVSQETNTRIHNVAYNENSRITKDILPTSNSSLTFRPWGSEYRGSERDDEISSNTSCKKQNPHYLFDGGLYYMIAYSLKLSITSQIIFHRLSGPNFCLACIMEYQQRPNYSRISNTFS